MGVTIKVEEINHAATQNQQPKLPVRQKVVPPAAGPRAEAGIADLTN